MEELGWRTPEERETKLKVNRARIDKLDEAIAGMLKERLELALEIGALKADSNIPVKDEGREQVVLDHVSGVVGNPALAESVRRVYKQLMEESRRLQGEGSERQPRVQQSTSFPKVLIVGCGLIGGALARRIKAVHPSTVVIGCDKPAVLQAAREAGVVDEVATDPLEVVGKASLIVLAASPRQNLELLKKIAPVTKARQVVVDVTSAKAKICRIAAELKMKADFIGGHPFFGSQKAGFENSDELLVTGKTFVLVPSAKATEVSQKRLTKWLEQLGLVVEVRDAEEHDATVAGTSHLVQLLSVALGSQLANGVPADELKQKLALSGSGLRTMTRLMASPYSMWAEILEQNSSAVCSSLSLMESRLALMRTAVATGQMDVIEAQFNTARKVAELLPQGS
jgi:prephenate dehydrogenase/chorismate mutase